jgi:hypothetical protein
VIVAVLVAHAEDTAAWHLAQARQFVKRGWYVDARAQIEAALLLPSGLLSHEAHRLGAQVCYELLDIDRAVQLADVAVQLAVEDAERDQDRAFAAFLRQNFGFVELSPPREGMTSRLQVELTSVLFDADLKRLFHDQAARLHEPTRLPARIALPAGDYLVNGLEVRIEAQKATSLALDMKHLGTAGLARLQVMRAELSGGLDLLTGDRVANLHPGATVELSITQPVGAWLAGVVGAWDARSYTAGDTRMVEDPRAFSVGGRFGRELVLGGPLVVRPSLGVRWRRVPGVGLRCDVAAALECTASSKEADVEVFVVGDAVAPWAELAVQYREAGRTTALGAGVKLQVEEDFGVVDSPGRAVLYDDPDAAQYEYTAEPAGWTATGFRLLADLSLAF